MTKTVVGVWCGVGVGQLMAQVHGVPLLRLVVKRVGPCFCLVPWTSELDWLESEIRAWKQHVRRTHTDRRVAMRDLMVELGADLGSIVPGDCGAIDREEIRLAEARVSTDWERHESPRVQCLKRREWLTVSDSEEWGPYPLDASELQKTLTPHGLDVRWAKLSNAKQVP